MKIYRAFMETRHFDFECLDTVESKAKKGLIKGLRKHCKQYHADWDSFIDHYPLDEISIVGYDLGVPHRDYEPLA